VEAQTAGAAEQVAAHVPHMYRASPEQVALLDAARTPRSREELQAVAGIRHRQHFLLEYLRPLLDAGLLELIIPDKPRSSKQRYRLTAKGSEFLKSQRTTRR
jgi:ATP-dependent DNA helicase RecG